MLNLSSPKILVIDNNRTFRSIVESCFKALGYQNVTGVSNGDTNLFNISQPADIVIIDNYLGENNLSGLEIMKIYKSLYPSACFFFYSSDRNIVHAKEAIKQGAIDYITKSIKGLQPLVISVEGFINSTRAKIEALQNKMPV